MSFHFLAFIMVNLTCNLYKIANHFFSNTPKCYCSKNAEQQSKTPSAHLPLTSIYNNMC